MCMFTVSNDFFMPSDTVIVRSCGLSGPVELLFLFALFYCSLDLCYGVCYVGCLQFSCFLSICLFISCVLCMTVLVNCLLNAFVICMGEVNVFFLKFIGLLWVVFGFC